MLSRAIEEEGQKPAPVMAGALVTGGIAGRGAAIEAGRSFGAKAGREAEERTKQREAPERRTGQVRHGRMAAAVVTIGVMSLGKETEAGTDLKGGATVSRKSPSHTDRLTEALLKWVPLQCWNLLTESWLDC